ncbi:hypothetical protein [uncultured Clostridium sp.]|nr:hypothetical protein [uncultured Clostridium sp.]
MKVSYKFEIEVSDIFEIEDEEVQEITRKAIKDNISLIGEKSKKI